MEPVNTIHSTSDWNSKHWDKQFAGIAKPTSPTIVSAAVWAADPERQDIILETMKDAGLDQVKQVTRTVQSDQLKQGILQFRAPGLRSTVNV